MPIQQQRTRKYGNDRSDVQRNFCVERTITGIGIHGNGSLLILGGNKMSKSDTEILEKILRIVQRIDLSQIQTDKRYREQKQDFEMFRAKVLAAIGHGAVVNIEDDDLNTPEN